MGWKSTMDIPRKEARGLVMEQLAKLLSGINQLSDSELADMLELFGYGEMEDLPYFGYNFKIVDE
jgi:hypothetical protein